VGTWNAPVDCRAIVQSHLKDMLHILTVLPCRPRWHDDHNWPGRFDALHGDRCLVERSRTPFCDGARALLAQGLADPGDRLVMRHAGSETDAMVSTVGTAAKLTVAEGKDGKPRVIAWRPHPSVSLRGPMRESAGEAVG
jgi:hypothetical protein